MTLDQALCAAFLTWAVQIHKSLSEVGDSCCDDLPGGALEAHVHSQSYGCGKQDAVAGPQPPGWAQSPAEPCRVKDARLQSRPRLRMSRVGSE